MNQIFVPKDSAPDIVTQPISPTTTTNENAQDAKREDDEGRKAPISSETKVETTTETEVKGKEGVLEGTAKSNPRTAFVKNAESKVKEVINSPLETETGATFNADGTVYEGGGLVVPGGSKNLTTKTMSADAVFDFMEEQKAKVENPDNIKFGIYKFKNKDQVSVDINIVVDPRQREAAIAFGKAMGQESLFDLDTFENVKTGSDGKNPRDLTDAEFAAAAKAFREGRVPELAPLESPAVSQNNSPLGNPLGRLTPFGKTSVILQCAPCSFAFTASLYSCCGVIYSSSVISVNFFSNSSYSRT
jgi:hypothetical protein